MRRRPSQPIPPALERLRDEIQQWRGQQSDRKRLPREFWAKAVALAEVHEVNRTARTLGLKYDSLRQRLAAQGKTPSKVLPVRPAFLELFPGHLMASGLVGTIEVDDGRGGTLRLQVPGATMADWAAPIEKLRGGQA
jgi:hypothetical protein